MHKLTFLWMSIYMIELVTGFNICLSSGGSCVKSLTACNGIPSMLPGCHSKRQCCLKKATTVNIDDIVGTGSPVIVQPDHPGTAECGLITKHDLTPTSRHKRVVGGEKSAEGEWPWQVALQDGFGHFCGGTLISTEWILTAAHCIINKASTDIYVSLGEHAIETPSGNEIHRRIKKIIQHQDYVHDSKYGYVNDLALLQLSTPVDVTGHYIRTACLPQVNDLFTSDDQCYISGWGNTVGTGDASILNHLQVSITSFEQCNASWSGVLADSHICAGDDGTGACKGDSGGPLVCLNEGKYALAGVTSWGSSSCVEEAKPTVFVRVPAVIEWIQTMTETNEAGS